MAKGKKTGGRKAGTPNKKTTELQDKLIDSGFDPIQELIEIAVDLQTSKDLKTKICSDLAQYVYPKRKAVEHSGEMTYTIEDLLLDDD